MKKNHIARFMAVAVAAVLVSAQVAGAAATPPDVGGKPYEAAVAALSAKDIITGDTDGNFYPESNLTRAQFCTIIVKAMQAPAASVEGTATQNPRKSAFPDLSGYGWAEGHIAYAVEKGVVNGYPEGTFKPGSNVTVSELATMTLRAAGYSDAQLGGEWPDNYLSKAEELGALKGLPSPLPTVATKWMAAQLVANMLPRVEAANVPAAKPDAGASEGAPTPGAVTSAPAVQPPAPSTTGLTYIGSGRFDGDILTFGGKDLASDVQVQTYKVRADYSSDMKLSTNAGDYMAGNIFKYKNVDTPAWYRMENGKVTRVILPNDVGFSGYAYCVINNIVRVADGEGNDVSGFVTLSAGRDITWFASTSMSNPNPSKEEYASGTIFELRLRNGKAVSIAAADGSFGSPTGNVVKELGPKDGFSPVKERSSSVLTFDNNMVVALKEKATVYHFDRAKGEYSAGAMGDVRKQTKVRLFDVSDDKEDAADIVVIED
jgi:hypothetical protein